MIFSVLVSKWPVTGIRLVVQRNTLKYLGTVVTDIRGLLLTYHWSKSFGVFNAPVSKWSVT